VVLHALAFPWSGRIVAFYRDGQLYDYRLEVALWGVSVSFLIPMIIGVVAMKVLESPQVDEILREVGLSRVHRTPTAWQFVINQERPAYVRVHLKDGKLIGGAYSSRSFSSGNPNHADLYLEESWLLTELGDFDKIVVNTQGVWISHDVISHIEFLEGSDEPRDQTDDGPSDPTTESESHSEANG
jgi:hypothetical protein